MSLADLKKLFLYFKCVTTVEVKEEEDNEFMCRQLKKLSVLPSFASVWTVSSFVGRIATHVTTGDS